MDKIAKPPIYILAILLLISCSKLDRNPSPESELENEIVVAKPTGTSAQPTSSPISTLVSNKSSPTPTIIVDGNLDLSSIYGISNQVTDGDLRLSIEESENRCYHPGETINVKMSYLNMTKKPITLVDYNFIDDEPMRNAYAHVVPVLTTADNRLIRAKEFFMNIDAFNAPIPIILEISPKASFEILGDYSLPIDIGEEDEGQRVTFRLLPPGQYFLKLVYIAQKYKGSWEGKISSNQITICVQN